MIGRSPGALVVRELIPYKMGNSNGKVDNRDQSNIACFRLPIRDTLVGRLPLLFCIAELQIRKRRYMRCKTTAAASRFNTLLRRSINERRSALRINWGVLNLNNLGTR